MKKYSFLTGVWKMAQQALIFGIPLLVLQFPEWANLTIAGVLNLVVNYLKVKGK